MNKLKISCLFFILFLFSIACSRHETDDGEQTKMPEPQPQSQKYRVTGSVERLDSALDQLIDPEAVVEVLDSGFTWAEGPLWLPDQQKLLFSDVPNNTILEWSESHGTRVYLSPSGYTGSIPRGGEPGSNGLFLDPEGRLLLCQHGDRRIARMDALLEAPAADFITLAAQYDGKKLNSPNDGCTSEDGTVYFTDPPYGLEGNVDDPKKELEFQGVYQLRDGQVKLITDQISRPNGIALSPQGDRLYVANSDAEKAQWLVFPIQDGTVGEGSVFLDVTAEAGEANPGLPDGMKIDQHGNLFASGPGGIWIISPDARVLGKIHTGQTTANCAFNTDHSVLYMTADDYLMRIKLH